VLSNENEVLTVLLCYNLAMKLFVKTATTRFALEVNPDETVRAYTEFPLSILLTADLLSRLRV
jgi:hypothetical protein